MAPGASRSPDPEPNPPWAWYWVEMGSQVGWVAVDSMGKIAKTAEVWGSLLGVRIAHLPAELTVTRLKGPIESIR